MKNFLSMDMVKKGVAGLSMATLLMISKAEAQISLNFSRVNGTSNDVALTLEASPGYTIDRNGQGQRTQGNALYEVKSDGTYEMVFGTINDFNRESKDKYSMFRSVSFANGKRTIVIDYSKLPSGKKYVLSLGGTNPQHTADYSPTIYFTKEGTNTQITKVNKGANGIDTEAPEQWINRPTDPQYTVSGQTLTASYRVPQDPNQKFQSLDLNPTQQTQGGIWIKRSDGSETKHAVTIQNSRMTAIIPLNNKIPTKMRNQHNYSEHAISGVNETFAPQLSITTKQNSSSTYSVTMSVGTLPSYVTNPKFVIKDSKGTIVSQGAGSNGSYTGALTVPSDVVSENYTMNFSADRSKSVSQSLTLANTKAPSIPPSTTLPSLNVGSSTTIDLSGYVTESPARTSAMRYSLVGTPVQGVSLQGSQLKLTNLPTGTHTIQLKAQVGTQGEFTAFSVVQKINATQAPEPNKDVTVESYGTSIKGLTSSLLHQFDGGTFVIFNSQGQQKGAGDISSSTTIQSVQSKIDAAAQGTIMIISKDGGVRRSFNF